MYWKRSGAVSTKIGLDADDDDPPPTSCKTCASKVLGRLMMCLAGILKIWPHTSKVASECSKPVSVVAGVTGASNFGRLPSCALGAAFAVVFAAAFNCIGDLASPC